MEVDVARFQIPRINVRCRANSLARSANPCDASAKRSITGSEIGRQTAPEQKTPSPDQELQQAIDHAGNDRAALVRNLEAFLKKYPEAPQRVRIYRALVEAALQLRDTTRAADYAERIVALTPDDMSMTVLAINCWNATAMKLVCAVQPTIPHASSHTSTAVTTRNLRRSPKKSGKPAKTTTA